MDIEEIKKRLEEIKKLAECDYAMAHSKTDNLYTDALRSIANGEKDSQNIAKEVLKAEKIDFERYYA